MIHFGQIIPPSLFRPTMLAVLAAIALVLGTSGCVQRRMMIRSNPSGALVYVDDYEIGTTPVSANFTYYGTRKIRLVKDGCETLTVMQDIRPPWYEIVPLDFVSENLVPGTIADRRTLDFQLRPQMVVPTDQLQARAEELRRNTRGGAAAPLAQPAGVVPQPVAPNGNIPPTNQPFSGPPPTTPEMLPVPPGIGGQAVHPVQP
ncbi:MAG: PEGA domain-containing protein [Pirellulales bacterium]|nr:PEGA domain-containing protein [Pirellulales bacterium]